MDPTPIPEIGAATKAILELLPVMFGAGFVVMICAAAVRIVSGNGSGEAVMPNAVKPQQTNETHTPDGIDLEQWVKDQRRNNKKGKYIGQS